MIGWEKHSGDSYHRVWPTADGNCYVIVVAKCADGWGSKWQRGPSYTVHESGGFATIEECLADLWQAIFETHEHYLRLVREDAIRKVSS